MRTFIMSLVATALFACDPGYRLHGLVLRGGGLPVSSALVSLRCPPRFDVFKKTETGPSGEFTIAALGCLPGDCSVQVSRRGATSRWDVAAGCLSRSPMCGAAACGESELQFCLAQDCSVLPNNAVQK